MSLPRVSVVVCNHNYGHFIADAIESALTQTLGAHEVIVVDDGSTDDSVAVARRFGDRIRLITQANGGQMSAYNTGFAAATGDVVVFLDSDDRLCPEAVQAVSQAMSDPAVARLQYRLGLIDASGTATGAVIPTLLADGDLGDEVRCGRLFLASPGSGNAYRVTVLRRIMPLPVSQEERHGADFFAGYGTALLGRVKALPTVLAHYRVHKAGDETSLCFGNARATAPQTRILQMRYERLKAWLTAALPGERLAPHVLPDFSLQKQDFANAVFSAPNYGAGLRAGLAQLPPMLRAIQLRHCALPMKLGLAAWGVLVWLLPRRLGMPLARHVCNPSSRRSAVN